MKSFFKKLAFVMALAMVVSSVAPAAAGAAEKEVIIVEQTGTEKVEYIVFENEGAEPQDFRFLNAPANWRETYKWSVVDPTVATVDQGGIVTPVKAGTTKLQFSLEGEVVAEAEILVKTPSTTNEFDLTQASATQLKLTFTDEVKLGADKFVLYMLIECDGVEEPVKWPATFTVDKDDKHVVWCNPGVKIGQGDKYLVVADPTGAKYEDSVVTNLKNVDTLKIKTETLKVVKDAAAVKVVTTKFLAGNVDLTSLYAGDYEVKYEVKPIDPKFDEDDFDYTVNKSDWSLSVEIYEEGCYLSITATLYDDDEKQIGQPVNTGVTCVVEEVKEWNFELKVVDWALVQKDAKCVDWDKKSIPADKSGKEGTKPYYIVLKFKDNDGKFWVTRPEAVQDDKGETDGNYGDAENQLIDGRNDKISKAGYTFTFYSTDSDLMLVDEETGAIGVYTQAEVSFYVKAEYDAEKASDSFEKYIFAKEIEILEATKLDKISANKNSVEIIVDALDDSFESTADVTMSAKDQHKGTWTAVNYSAYYTNKDGKKEVITTGINGNKITFSAAQFDGKVNTTSVVVTIVGESAAPFATEKDETTVTVKLVEPKYTDNNKTQIKVDVEERNHYKTYDSVVVKADNIDIKATTTASKATGFITLYKTSGDLKVGYHTGFVAIDSKATLDSMTNEGDRYVVMKDVDGNIVPLTWTGNKLMYTLNTTDATKLDAQSNELLVYAKTGDYTVEVVTVRYHDKNTTRRGDIVETATVKVENNAAKITVDKIKTTEFGADCYDEANNKFDLADVAYEVIQFKLNGYNAVKPENIEHVEAVVIGNSVILQYVVINVPVGGGAYVQMKVEPSKPVALKYNANKVYN